MPADFMSDQLENVGVASSDEKLQNKPVYSGDHESSKPLNSDKPADSVDSIYYTSKNDKDSERRPLTGDDVI